MSDNPGSAGILAGESSIIKSNFLLLSNTPAGMLGLKTGNWKLETSPCFPIPNPNPRPHEMLTPEKAGPSPR